jgi:methylmalonyl-CoA mutase cobalamin-binding domain/chain
MNDELVIAMADLERDKVFEIVRNELMNDMDPLKIIESLSEGIKIVGERFEQKEYFLAELITGGDIFETIFQEIKPALEKRKADPKTKGIIVIGTVKGDVHDIGKNIVKTILMASGFHVKDLGVDVPAEKFVESVQNQNVKILGLSALLTIAIDSVEELIEILKKENLRDNIKIIIGGSAFNENIAKNLDVDAFGNDPMEAVKFCQKYIK